MLVLTRRPGEEIIIGDDIRVQIIKVQGGAVRLGIIADKAVPIRRGELDLVKEGNK